MSTPIYEFEEIIGGYGGSIIVRGVSGGLAAGEVLGITGRNGVGKSTLLKLLYGYLKLQAGSIKFDGHDVSGNSPSANVRAGISYCPQERIVFDDLSVWENLSLMHQTRTVEDLADCFDRFPKLNERLQQRAGTLSGGERKILSFIRTLSEDLPLVLMDEPTEGVQQENIDHMAQLIGQAKSARRSFVVVEQNLNFIETVADHLLVMDQGSVVLAGRVDEINRERLISHLSM
jgi:ABC-type branched-subunit amino acid transport system ATPase component